MSLVLSVILVSILVLPQTVLTLPQSITSSFASLSDFNLIEGGLYTGDFKSGVPHGSGFVVYFTDDVVGRYNYTGSWSKGFRHGQGTTIFRNGDVHSGTYDRDKLQGRGKLEYANGDVFEGFFRKGKREGSGRLHYVDDSRRVGEWQNDKLVGFILYHPRPDGNSNTSLSATVERWEDGKRKSDLATEEDLKGGKIKAPLEQANNTDKSTTDTFPVPSDFSRSPRENALLPEDQPPIFSSKLPHGTNSKNNPARSPVGHTARELNSEELKKRYEWVHPPA